ncbi:hypothetical protein LMG31886_14700 [Xanthomonas hydrangeae]|nr:hypothetical protein LMG31885_00790 [Xanthomonas hydrangeae]CAD7719501.1 hypothetical protein LMG31885_00790 [Xanthomonas hydrangeae]CAD7730808.1 hypothetical protein LMG31886_14700 [Xanthomonas hydrangeae]CAD7730812.1 hypothetical protein LMG31886_14700 [Xanthomonas hydrangeae]
MQGALKWTLRTLRAYRLPEPTRLADRLASRRGGKGWGQARCFDPQRQLRSQRTLVFQASKKPDAP